MNMQPDRAGPLGQQSSVHDQGASQMTPTSRPMSRSATGPRRILSEESWVEISSQPSSSSLSSVGDEIVTTGLTVQNRSDQRRRRRLNAIMADTSAQQSPRLNGTADSSQDEYEESSSDSDRVLSSSTEDMVQKETPSNPVGAEQVAEEEDEDDTSTALGVRTMEDVFTPQPNAFSHPPAQLNRATSAPTDHHDSYFSHPPSSSDRLPSNRTLTSRDLRRPSAPNRRSTHTPYNMISPSHTYQPDHDAALRASLSTLLSCAAAARGLPKRDANSRTSIRRPVGDAIDTNTLRMVPESALLGEDESLAPPLPSRRPLDPSTGPSSKGPSPPASVKAEAISKRRATRESSKERHSKKSRGPSTSRNANVFDETAISPTLMTWMVSAGVVILFSAISFSAGFVWGREVGRLEAGGLAAPDLNGQSTSCGGELASKAGYLRKLRWGSGGAASVTA